MKAISFVLPLKVSAHENGSDLDRVARILLPSLVRFFDLTQIDKLMIVVPPDQSRAIARVLDKFAQKLRLSVIPETELLNLIPGWTKHRRLQRLLFPFRKADRLLNKERFFQRMRLLTFDGWLKQQLLKLAAARLVETDYYMTLDSDLCLTRPTDLATLFPSGTAIFSPEEVGVHGDWWAGSARVLDIPLELKASDTGMSVTPQILSTRVCRDLVVHLAQKATDKGFFTVFEYLGTNRTWTEYTLYWLFLRKFYDVKAYYNTQNSVSTIHWDYCVWDRDDAPDREALDARIRGAFGDDRGLFLVIQSRCVPFSEFYDSVKGDL